LPGGIFDAISRNLALFESDLAQENVVWHVRQSLAGFQPF